MGETQRLSDGDKTFIKLFGDGAKKSAAFREAYPDHPATLDFYQTEPGTPERQKASEALASIAKSKLNAKYIKRALMTYQDKMEEFSVLSLETATDLVKNARSEKVRADLAIEGIRHKIGSPTTKVQVQEQKMVILQFGTPPEGEIHLDGAREVIDVSEADDPSESADN